MKVKREMDVPIGWKVGVGQDPAKQARMAEPATGPKPGELSPAAQRALAEAAERRRLHAEAQNDFPKEVHGRGGSEPVRFGDWEVKGLAVDF